MADARRQSFHRVIPLLLQLLDLLGERGLLLLERLDLVAQARGLASLVDSGADGEGKGCGDQSLLQCGHNNGFGGGGGYGGGEAGSGEGGSGGNGDGQSGGRGLDGVGGDGDDQAARADGDTAFGEELRAGVRRRG